MSDQNQVVLYLACNYNNFSLMGFVLGAHDRRVLAPHSPPLVLNALFSEGRRSSLAVRCGVSIHRTPTEGSLALPTLGGSILVSFLCTRHSLVASLLYLFLSLSRKCLYILTRPLHSFHSPDVYLLGLGILFSVISHFTSTWCRIKGVCQ